MNQVKFYNGNMELQKTMTAAEVSEYSWRKFDGESGGSNKNTTSRNRGRPKKAKKIAPAIQPRHCKGCQIEYTPSRADNMFCSKKCQQKVYRKLTATKKIGKICPKCLKNYMATPSRKWCNDPCGWNVDYDGIIRWRRKK